ncbi:MAG: hypothetical protein ACI9FR_000114 [Cryomorphaceae bacterium]|jgi:hypothetical protein
MQTGWSLKLNLGNFKQLSLQQHVSADAVVILFYNEKTDEYKYSPETSENG